MVGITRNSLSIGKINKSDHTRAIGVNMYGAVVHFCKCLELNVVSIDLKQASQRTPLYLLKILYMVCEQKTQ